MGRLKKAPRITKHAVIIQVNPIKPTNYTIVHVKAVVMQATSYDVLVGGGEFCIPLESPWIFGKRLLIINQDGKHEITIRLF
jgi:hypothetical protein